MSSPRLRVVLFAVFTLTCIGATVVYIRWRVTPPVAVATIPMLDPAKPEDRVTIDQLRAGTHAVFLSSRTDAFGHIGLTTIENASGTTLLSGLECERGYFGKAIGLCLELNRESMNPRGFAVIVDAHFQKLASFPLAGLPIRARISSDQRYGVATAFVTGENYSGDFTTRTTLFDLTARTPIADLEQFTVERDGRPFHAVDFNFWGVTFFNDGNRFFATLGTGGQRLLVDGNIARRHMKVVATDVECPSLSPDERHLVFKRKGATGSGWRLYARNVTSGESWPITPDGQDLDDQAEWLDNERVVYGRLFGDGIPENTLGLWISAIARPSGFAQQLFLRSASSPSVIR